jgi:hypothetical protein
MIWEYIRVAGFLAFVVLTLFFVVKRKYEALLWLYFFSFPFQNFAQYVLITTWNPYKIVSSGMLLLMLIEKRNPITPVAIKNLFFFFCIFLFASNSIALLFPPSSGGNLPVIRLLVQDFTYLLGFIPLFYLKYLPSGFIEKAYLKYCLAIETTIIIGIIHYLFIRLNIPFSPIMRDFGATNDEVVTTFGVKFVNRIYGFCGEPKNMAFALVPYIYISLLAFFFKKIRRNQTYHIFFLFLALFVLIQTYSSAAFIELIICIPAFIYISIKNKLALRRFLPVFILTGVAVFIFISIQNNSLPFFDAFYERTFERAGQELEDERQEVIVFNKFQNENNLMYRLFGYGIGQYSYHNNMFFDKGIVPMQSGLVLHLVDFGYLGYLYILIFCIFSVNLLKKSQQLNQVYPILFWIGALATFIGDMMYSMIGNLVTGPILFIALSYWTLNKNHISSISKV